MIRLGNMKWINLECYENILLGWKSLTHDLDFGE
jgi:hypothetical protein